MITDTLLLPASIKMKLPKTVEELIFEIYKSIDLIDKISDLRVRQLSNVLPNVPDDVIIEGVIQIFESSDRTNTIFTDQKVTGGIILDRNPKTSLNAESLITRVINNWDKSIWELPFWFRNNYGTELLKQTFEQMELNESSEIKLDKIKTMRYFLNMK